MDLWKEGGIDFDTASRILSENVDCAGRSAVNGTSDNAVSGNGAGATGTGAVSSGQPGTQAQRRRNTGKGRGNPEYRALISTIENLSKQAKQGQTYREEDAEYMKAIKSVEMETALIIVDAAT